uniref:Uncharacterized protein n=1 Tax=Hucho hucho TaxID=62062 RepID=A0A4W5Q5X8_9TELE
MVPNMCISYFLGLNGRHFTLGTPGSPKRSSCAVIPERINLVYNILHCMTQMPNNKAAVKTALRMNDPRFAMSIYEEAGDVFFKGNRNRLASLPFYRDGSLPFARSIGDVDSEFRLLSKLTELLMTHEEHEEALQYAILAVQTSTRTGNVGGRDRVQFPLL